MFPMSPLWAQWSIVGYLFYPVAAILFDEALQATSILGVYFGGLHPPGTLEYVVFCGGTAGLTLARRLAADTSNTFAVIEAGGILRI